MVGSEIKGTIYAHGRDSSYHITVEEPTSRIDFKSEMSGLRIFKIVVVFGDDTY